MYCDVTLWCVRVIFLPPRLFQQPDAVSLREHICGDLMWPTTIKCPIFVPEFKQIWIFLTDFHESVEYKILRKYVQWESR